MVECSQGIELLQGKDQRLMGRWIHEVKVDQIVDAQALQEEDNVAEVRSLDLKWNNVVRFL